MTTAAPLVADTTTSVARDLLARLESAWNSGDGEAFGAVYTPDASFVTVRGDRVNGRHAIAAGHAGIFATIYAGSRNTMELVDARLLTEGVILATSDNTLECPSGPLAGTNLARSTKVLVRDDAGTWAIEATHNTLVVG